MVQFAPELSKMNNFFIIKIGKLCQINTISTIFLLSIPY